MHEFLYKKLFYIVFEKCLFFIKKMILQILFKNVLYFQILFFFVQQLFAHYETKYIEKYFVTNVSITCSI